MCRMILVPNAPCRMDSASANARRPPWWPPAQLFKTTSVTGQPSTFNFGSFIFETPLLFDHPPGTQVRVASTQAPSKAPVTGMCSGNSNTDEDVNCANEADNTQNKGATSTGTTTAQCCKAPVTGMCSGNSNTDEDVNCANEAGNTQNKGATSTGTTTAQCCKASIADTIADTIATPPSFLQRTSRRHMSLDTDDELDASLSTSHTFAEIQGDKPFSHSAPVLCKNTPTRVEYWAIGTDCCDQRKNFHCDGGADLDAHSGVLVRATGDEEIGGDRHQFFSAISQAVAAHDLPAPERPVLIRWGKDPGALQDDWSRAAITMVLLTAILGFLVMMSIGIGSFWFLKITQKNAEVEREARRQKRQQLRP